MRAFAIRWIPLAASRSVSPSGSATVSTARAAASAEIAIWPSATVTAGM